MRAGYHPEKNNGEKNELKKQGFYHWPAWRQLRTMALHRDHYLCQECLRKKRIRRATEVHHVKPIADFPELALELDNLESLCWNCHEETKPRKAVHKPKGVRVIRISDGTDKEEA